MSSGFQFEDLMSIAETNAVKGEKKIRTSTAPQFNLSSKPKKETPKDRKLSEGVQKFLKKREEEERRVQVEKKIKKEELLQLRAQDKKAHKRVNSMLRMTKSANKACIADARDSFSDALAEQGEMQPDEDDYGYTSQYSQDMYKKLLDKYKLVPTNKPTPSKLPAPLPVPQNIAKTRHKEVVDYDYETEASAEKLNDFKEPEIVNTKKKKKAPPPPINFQDLLALANQKVQEPVGVKIKNNTKPQVKEVFEFGRPMTAKEKAQFLQEQAYKEKIQKGSFNSSTSAKSSSASSKSNDSPQPAASKVGFKIPSKKTPVVPAPAPAPAPTPAAPLAAASKTRDPEAKDKKVPNSSSRGVSQNIPPSSSSKSALPNRNHPSSSKSHSQPSPSGDRPSMKSNSMPEKIRKELDARKEKSEYVPGAKSKPPTTSDSSRRPPINQEKFRTSESMQSSKPMSTKSKPMSSMSENSSQPRQVDRQRPRSPLPKAPVQRREKSPPRHLPPQRQRPPQKRRQVIESDEEYDSEMDDFIDDGEDEMNVSELIRSITGYDRRNYKDIDEDDIQESGFAAQMREECRSARIGKLEDAEEARLEAEENKRIAMMKKKKMKR